VTVMSSMLLCTNSNQPICDWDVSAMTNMDEMFRKYYTFNQYIGDWDVSGC
jgi:hypothetical protein